MDLPRVIRMICSLCAVAAIFSPRSADAQCQFKKLAELDVHLESGVPLIGVTVNGKHGWVVFSNRSNVTGLYKGVVDELALKYYATDYFTNKNGKKSPVYGVHVGDFKIDGMAPTVTDLFVVTPARSPEPLVWGVLSTSLFLGKVIEYDYPNKKINIYAEKYCGGKSLAYWDSDAHPVELEKQDLSTFSGDIDGATFRVQINSDRRISTINEPGLKAAKLPLKDDPLPTGAMDREIYSDKIATIDRGDIAGERLRNIDIRVVANPTASSIPGEPIGGSRNYDEAMNALPKIVLGVDYLLTHHVLISPTQRLAYITPTGGRPFDTTIHQSDPQR